MEEEAAQKILEAKDLYDKSHCKTLIQAYKGNPKILQMVAATIKSVYNGRVGEFLQKLTSLVTGDVEDFIGQQIDRLTDLEDKVLYELAKQISVSLAQIQENLSLSSLQLDRAIESLIRRSLIERSDDKSILDPERSDDKFILDPVVIDYVINRWKFKPEED